MKSLAAWNDKVAKRKRELWFLKRTEPLKKWGSKEYARFFIASLVGFVFGSRIVRSATSVRKMFFPLFIVARRIIMQNKQEVEVVKRKPSKYLVETH